MPEDRIKILFPPPYSKKPIDPKDTSRDPDMQLKIVKETSDQILDTPQQYFVGDRTLLMKVLGRPSPTTISYSRTTPVLERSSSRRYSPRRRDSTWCSFHETDPVECTSSAWVIDGGIVGVHAQWPLELGPAFIAWGHSVRLPAVRSARGYAIATLCLTFSKK